MKKLFEWQWLKGRSMAVYAQNAIFLTFSFDCLSVGTYQISFDETFTYLLVSSFILKRKLPVQKSNIQAMFVSACYFIWQHYLLKLLPRNTSLVFVHKGKSTTFLK